MSETPPLNFGPDFQGEMLTLMLRDPQFASGIVKWLSEERLCSDSHKFLFCEIRKHIGETGLPPSYLKVETLLMDIDPAKRRLIKAFVKKVYENTPKDPDFVKNKMTEYAKMCVFVDVFQEAQVLWNSKKREDAYELTSTKMAELFSIDLQDSQVVDIGEFDKRRREYVADTGSRKRIATLIPPLDEILSGGIEKGELATILALPKKGKSISLVHMGYAGLVRGEVVVHVVLEGRTEQTIMRYQARLSGISYNQIKLDKLTDEERKRLSKVSEKYLGKLKLIPLNKHWTYTIRELEAQVRNLKSAGFSPSLLVLDYADLLKAGGNFKEHRFEQTEVYRGLKQLAMMHQIAIWTASQSQRPDDKDEAGLVTSKNIAESFEKARIVDFMASLNQTQREKEMGVLRLHADIYRDGEADKTIWLVTDFSRMILYSKKYGCATQKDLFAWVK